jgi:hypothetical protein
MAVAEQSGVGGGRLEHAPRAPPTIVKERRFVTVLSDVRPYAYP